MFLFNYLKITAPGTFHEPKTVLHKVQKMMMLETDSPETLNEMIVSVRKQGKCGIIAAYAGFANGVNVGALMEKGVRYVSPSTTTTSL